MKYNKEPLKLNSPVSFWMNFPNEERVFWVDRQSDRIVVGAKRLATVKDDDDRHNYAYVFYGDTFFDTVKCFFSHGLFRVTVPLLTCISAFLLFESKLYLNYKLLLNNFYLEVNLIPEPLFPLSDFGVEFLWLERSLLLFSILLSEF